MHFFVNKHDKCLVMNIMCPIALETVLKIRYSFVVTVKSVLTSL